MSECKCRCDLKSKMLRAKDLVVDISYDRRWNAEEFEDLNRVVKILIQYYKKLDK